MPKEETVGIRVAADQARRWRASAVAKGRPFADWARELLEVGATGLPPGVTPPQDEEYSEALDALLRRYPVGDPAIAIRASVIACARMRAAGHDPWGFVAEEGPPAPLPGPRSVADGKPRGR